MASITWKAYEEILFQHSTYVAYMVVDYLTCKELTALQSCRKKKVGKILIRLLIDYTRSPDKLLELYEESTWSPSGFMGECQLQGNVTGDLTEYL